MSRHFCHILHNTWVYNHLSMSMAFQIVIYLMSMLMVNSVSHTVGNLIFIIKTFFKFLLSCKENLWQLYIFKIPKLLVLEMKIWSHWSESNSWIYFYIILNKNWNIYWSKQSFTGLIPKDRCSSRGLSSDLINWSS